MASLAELQGMRLWTQWGKQRRFGYPLVKGMPKPKGWSDLQKAYNENKIYLYNTKKITFEYAKSGQGNSGVRHFKYYMVPPLQYWNPDITFVEIKTNGAQPKLTIELENGTIKEFDARNLRERDILLKVLLETKTISLPQAFEQQIQNATLNVPHVGAKVRSKQRKEKEKKEERDKLIAEQRQKDDETAKQNLSESIATEEPETKKSS